MALIDIGSHKQLFVDDYLIESMTDTMPVMNPARKVENNPVLQPEMPWEGNDVRPRHIFFDEQDRLFGDQANYIERQAKLRRLIGYFE